MIRFLTQVKRQAKLIRTGMRSAAMRYAVILFAFFFCMPTTLWAESKYVTEIRDIMFRTGPGTQYRITHAIKTGTQVEIISESDDDEWTQIRLPSGKEGWVLKHFLQEDPPSSILLAQLKDKHHELDVRAEKLSLENNELHQKINAMSQELDQHRQRVDTLNKDYDSLKKESADFLALQMDFKQTKEALRIQQDKADKMENELAKLYNDKRLWWFLAGAGVLFGGILIGFITKPQRRRSKLL